MDEQTYSELPPVPDDTPVPESLYGAVYWAVKDALASDRQEVDQASENVSLMADGEILVPEEGPLVVIQHVVQALQEYFQEDDNQLLSDIRDNTESILEVVTDIRDSDTSRPFLTTSFSDYSVTEGLLLLILLWSVIQYCIRRLKGGFSWFLW